MMNKETAEKNIQKTLKGIKFAAKKALDGAVNLWKKARTISFDKALLIWVLALAAGFVLFKVVSKELPGMSSSLVFATWWEDSLEEETLSGLVSEFMSQNPGITVKLEKKNWDEIWTLLEDEERVNGRNDRRRSALDIFSIDPYAIHELERRSFLAAFENDEISSGNALQVISFINPLFYNIDLLQAAGFDRPPKNQTEFLSYVQRLKETGVNGAGLALSDPRNIGQQLLSWIWTSAGNPEAVQSFSFNSREMIAVLNFLNQLNQNLYSDPFTLSEAELLETFADGNLGMMIGSTRDIQKLKATEINFGITTIPSPESYTKKPVFPLTVWYVGINHQSNNQEGAQKFAVFLKERAETIAAAAYAVPGYGIRNRERSRNDPYYAKAFDMYEAAEMVREIYVSSNLNDFNSIIQMEIELMFQGNKTPEACAEAIQLGWQDLAGTTPGFR